MSIVKTNKINYIMYFSLAFYHWIGFAFMFPWSITLITIQKLSLKLYTFLLKWRITIIIIIWLRTIYHGPRVIQKRKNCVQYFTENEGAANIRTNMTATSELQKQINNHKARWENKWKFWTNTKHLLFIWAIHSLNSI